nr:caspase family protein [Coleofasciculus chthonoplastes]
MTCTIYALLVGIDNYPYPISPLQGCVNDITVVAEYLRRNYGKCNVF